MINTLAPEAIATLWVAALNGRDLTPLTMFCRPDVSVHAATSGGDEVAGLERVSTLVQAYGTAFPDGRFTIDEVSERDDVVACRWTARGVNTGAFLHLPPTHRDVAFRGTCRFRFVDGLVAEHWFEFNLYDLLQQLGALLPAPGEAFPASLAVSQQAFAAWTEALAGRAWSFDAFAPDVLVTSYCFRLRTIDVGMPALVRALAFIQAALSDIEIVTDRVLGQGSTITYRGRISGRSATTGERDSLGFDCMFKTQGNLVGAFWLRIWRTV